MGKTKTYITFHNTKWTAASKAKQVQNVQIQIHPTRAVSSGHLLSIDTFCNAQWFC